MNMIQSVEERGLQKTFYINDVPDNILLENTTIFRVMLKRFNLNKGKKYSSKDIICNLYLLEEFDIFMTSLLFTRKLPIVINPNQLPKVLTIIKSFRERFLYSIKAIDAYYVEVKNTIYPNSYSDIEKEPIDEKMKPFLSAYQTMKLVFDKKMREGKDSEGKYIRYFDHLKGVMEIALRELPNPNIDKIIIALLHDAIEDIDGMTFEIIGSIYGYHIATGVRALSKKKMDDYLASMAYIDKYKIEQDGKTSELYVKAKALRTEDYFGRMSELDDDILDVKFADRIHNLRTLDLPGIGMDKIIRKILETEKYFMNLAKTRNPRAYELMLIEINKIRIKYKTEFESSGIPKNMA